MASDNGDMKSTGEIYKHARHAAPPAAQNGNGTAASDASAYAASNYGRGKKKSKHAGKKKHRFLPLKIILAILLIALLGAGGAAFAYVQALDQKLGFDDSSNNQDVQSALTPVEQDQPFYMLLLGSDSRKYSTSEEKKGVSEGKNYSDVMMLARVDAANKQVTLISIPRDTRWYDKDRGKIRKINSAYNDGPTKSIEAVEQLTGVKISHYAQINMDGFDTLVDAVGGITVNVPTKIGYKNALTKEYIEIEAGTQTLNGEQAQIFARARHEYKDQEATRQSNNRQIVEALLTSIRNTPVDKLPEVGLSIASCLDTDFSSSSILPLAKQFISGNITLYSGTGPTEGDIYQDDQLWYCYTNTEGWKELMETVEAGKDPSKIKYTTPQSSQDEAHNLVENDTVHDPQTATDLSGTTY